MRKFLIRFCVFLLPCIVFLSIPLYILIITGEKFKNIDSVVNDNEKYLIGYAYDERSYGYLKYLEITKSKYKVIALGSSRVLQFRNQMFTTSFYNAGYTIQVIEDFIPFLENIPSSKTPKYLIIGLDQCMFNEFWNSDFSISDKNKWQHSFYKYPTFGTIMKIWKDVIDGKIQFHADNSIKRIGVNAVMNNTGFRNDGSMYYGGQIDKLIRNDSSANDYLFNDTFDRIYKGNRRFEYGNAIDVKTISQIHELLQYCKKRNIKLIAFLPPFADSVFSKMINSGKYDYIKEIYANLKPVFDEFGFELYDFSSASSCASNDNEMIDGFHGGEATYIKMLIKMLEGNSILSEIVDKPQLEQEFKKRNNNFIIYE